jgi:hypothetical protein
MTSASVSEIETIWEGREIRLSYFPRRWCTIDQVEIQAADGKPLPITETGFRSYFFRPLEPALGSDDVAQMITSWLDQEAASPAWQDYLRQSAQLWLF